MKREDYLKWVLFFTLAVTLIILGVTGRIAVLLAVVLTPDDVLVS